jgi:hypothetical protein
MFFDDRTHSEQISTDIFPLLKGKLNGVLLREQPHLTSPLKGEGYRDSIELNQTLHPQFYTDFKDRLNSESQP